MKPLYVIAAARSLHAMGRSRVASEGASEYHVSISMSQSLRSDLYSE
jgi:hypothetical protein